jgi:release factor glutamine methyltransferase
MRTLLEILKLSTTYLEQNGTAHPRRQAEELLCTALEMERMHLYLEHDRPLTDQELEKVRAWLRRRSKGEPLAYISGTVEFFGCELHITPEVLIPRQETEILADLVSKSLSELPLEGKILWDLCCGSGCLGLALKKKHPALQVALADLSESALNIARLNAEANQLSVELLQGDLLAPFTGRKADFLLCNPPYVTEEEWHTLDRDVKEYEPKEALVGGIDGLIFYRRLAVQLPQFLSPGARVWLENGYTQAEALYMLFNAPCWKTREIKKDWSGKDRFFFLEIE